VTELLNSQTGWLTITNAALGLAVLVCLVAVGRVVLQEVRALASERLRSSLAHDDHAFNLESLGITMADGGEPTKDFTRPAGRTTVDPDEPSNCIRSDN
jgi:hypothetical protein